MARVRARNPRSALYVDLEKFHRVIGYYEGQRVKPLELHEKFVQNTLDKVFLAVEANTRKIQYDLNLTTVFSENEKVFQTDRPEVTLLYLLFSEGIKSLIMHRELSALEVKNWCLLVRDTLLTLDKGEALDLASVLWRNPYRNLRARVYNALMDFKETRAGEITLSDWHKRDLDWDLPSGDAVDSNGTLAPPIDVSDLKRMKRELFKGLYPESESFHINESELETLSFEMSSYDQSQVEFNLLAWNMAPLKAGQNIDTELTLKITQSILNRFHPGLIVFLLELLEGLKNPLQRNLYIQIKETISKTLLKPDNARRLVEALDDPLRNEISKKLLPYLDRDQFPAIVDHYLKKSDEAGLLEFLHILLRRKLPVEDIFISWGEKRLNKIMPLLRRLSWDDKASFLLRALQCEFPEVIRQASYFILSLPLDTEMALKIFKKSSEDIQGIWLKCLGDSAPLDAWKGFVSRVIEDGLWISSSNRMMHGWVQTGFKYLNEKAFDFFERWVIARRFRFWPKFGLLRDCVLSVCLDLESQALKKVFEARWLDRESKLRFQNQKLKHRLLQRRNSLP